jgi:RNA polymerase sigma factor (TIGR02999 family)
MEAPGPQIIDIRPLLSAAKQGDRGAEAQLFSMLYNDLRRLAHNRLRRPKPPTLVGTTTLVHEAYLRFQRVGYLQIKDRGHFLGYAAHVMRSVIVDLVRERGAARRGGTRVPLDLDRESSAPPGEREIMRVHYALEELARVSDRMVRIVEMRYFSGMNEAEIAEALDLSERTVRREWEKARMVLATALK